MTTSVPVVVGQASTRLEALTAEDEFGFDITGFLRPRFTVSSDAQLVVNEKHELLMLVDELCGPGAKLDSPGVTAAPAEWMVGIGRNVCGNDLLQLRYENLAAPSGRGSGLPPPAGAKEQLECGRCAPTQCCCINTAPARQSLDIELSPPKISCRVL